MRRCSICLICDVSCENPAACVTHKAMVQLVHGIRKEKVTSKLKQLLQNKFFIFKFYFLAVPLKLLMKVNGKNFPLSKLVKHVKAFLVFYLLLLFFS